MKPTEKNKPTRKQSGKDLRSSGKQGSGTGKGKGNLSSGNAMGKSRSNQDAAEEKSSQKHSKQDGPGGNEFKNPDITDGFDLDVDIRNDIKQTEINPHAKKRGPMSEEREEENTYEEDLNEDSDVVNEQEDDKDRKKYNKY